MPLLVQRADNTQIDHQLRAKGVDPAWLPQLPSNDLSDPHQADMFSVWLQMAKMAPGVIVVIARSEQQTFDYGSPVGVGPAVTNSTPDVITREIGGEVTVGTTKSFSVSSTVEADLFSVVKVSVTASYSQEWRKDQTFKDYLSIPIQPGYTCWLQRETVMRRITGGDFIVVTPGPGVHRYSGTINGPGLAGTLQDRIEVISRRINASQLASVTEQLGTKSTDGVLEFPAAIAAML
ncbi:hypothetical protein ABZ769_00455 [Streptomyces olivoreticuli]